MDAVGVPIEILLVEDNPGDARLTREALRDAKVRNHLHVAADGVEALAFLRREGKHEAVPKPDLILLDLNLPKRSEEHTSELQSQSNLVCRLLLEKKNKTECATPCEQCAVCVSAALSS